MIALTLYLMMNGLTSLYVISALFGFFQGGLVTKLRDHSQRKLPQRKRPAAG